ncbi:14344_t:CDS:2, partial [Entrophospora sp. SA101]
VNIDNVIENLRHPQQLTVGGLQLQLAFNSDKSDLSKKILVVPVLEGNNKIKHSPEVIKFWNDYRTQNLQQDLQYIKAQNELKTLRIETEDLNYILGQGKELDLHASIIGNKRKLMMEKMQNDYGAQNIKCRTKNGRIIPNYRELSGLSERKNESSNNNKQPNIKEKTSTIRPTKKMKSSDQTESENDPILDVECEDIEAFFNDDYTDDQSIDDESTDDEFTDDEYTDDKLNMSSVEEIEKVIYDFAKNLNRESYLHSFIINDADVDTKNLFTPDEWKEIKNFESVERPKLDPRHKKLLIKYTVNDIKKLQSLLFEPLISDGEEYNRSIHFCLDSINNGYRGILRLWEMDEDSLKLEGWFEMNVWSRIIDSIFDDLNIDLIHGKINGTKYMTDSLKISKMLKDMLDKLITECKMKEELVKKLKVIGILHGANRLQVLTVDHPFGYITQVNRNNIQEVSGQLTNSKPLALVLKEILYARSYLIRVPEAIKPKALVYTR